MGEASSGVRPDWMFEVHSSLQRAVGPLLLDLNPRTFRQTVVSVAVSLPAPEGLFERLTLRGRVREFAMSAGRAFHRGFHAATGDQCQSSPPEIADRLWSHPKTCDRDPRRTLAVWATVYLRALRCHHPWPAEISAAVYIARNFSKPVSLEELARSVGMSRTALLSAFRRRYNVAPMFYLRLVRAREAGRRLQETSDCVDSIARGVGYASTKNLYALFREVTGMTPAEVRRSSRAWQDLVSLPTVPLVRSSAASDSRKPSLALAVRASAE